MDGAGGLKIFRYITLPHLRQYLELATLLGAIYIVQTFDAVYSITQAARAVPPPTCPMRSI